MKKLLFVVLLISCTFIAATAAFSQTRPKLAILPFTGGTGGDGETIATLFTLQNDILNAFNVVPRTSAVNALVAEQQFQLAGHTDSDTVARLGRMLDADYVISGHIRRLGNRNLVIASIVHVATFEQLSGDYREYQNISEVQAMLPGMSKKMIDAMRRNTSALPKLAVAPFRIANLGGANVQEAEALAQILAAEIINTNSYAVLPRTEAVQTAMRELEIQTSGATAGTRTLGQGINAQYVLNAEVRSLGTMNMFTASILHVEDGSQIAGAYRIYQTISDGTKLMAELARQLANRQTTATRQRPRLGILPFTGSAGGDGETIAALFSFQSDILNAFTMVPRTGAVNSLAAEQSFQTAGYTDFDTIARLGQLLNADYIVSGHIRRIGNRNLVITTIVNVETFELLAGDYREYRDIRDVEGLMPGIAQRIINAPKYGLLQLPKLAVAPFQIATNTGVNTQDAEALAQILAIEVANTGQYAVLPRTTSIQQAMGELKLQMSGATSQEGVKAIGRATNAQFVLNGEVHSLGDTNMFTIQVLDVEDGSISKGGYQNYRTIEDGIKQMSELALLLYDQEAAARLTLAREKAEQQENARLAQQAERERRERERQMELEQRQREQEQRQQERQARRIARGPYSFVPNITAEAGYVFAPYLPVGLRFGLYGLYMTFGFNSAWTQSTKESPLGMTPTGENQWGFFSVLGGYQINLISNWLALPIGMGLFAEQNNKKYYRGNLTTNELWAKEGDQINSFLLEIGLTFTPGKWISLQFAFRSIGFDELSFSIGAGLIYPRKR